MIRKDVLPNGLRIVTEDVPYVQSISVGIWVVAGSRDESPENMGISHFIEHMMFKGTEKRTAKQIAEEFESIGGQVNAFTDKEYTCYYCRVLSEYLPTAIDVLSDMLLNSVHDPKEIELEKGVVLEEIKRREDAPEDYVHDLFAERVWKNHVLGNPVIGTVDTVSKFQRSDIKDYLSAKYRPDSILVSVAGNCVHEEVVDYVSNCLGGLTGRKEPVELAPPEFMSESYKLSKDTGQVHFCIGSPGYSQLDDERYTLSVVDTILGGGMSSRLFQEIREKRGLVYSIGSYSALYREGGYFSAYGGTSIDKIEDVYSLTKAEFENILKENVTDDELTRSKNQIRGGLLLGLENMRSRMIRIARSEIYHNRIVPIDELIEHTMSVSHEDIDRVAHYMWAKMEAPLIAIGPFDKKGGQE